MKKIITGAGSGALLIFLVVLVKSSVIDWYVVPTGSMKPTLFDNDVVIIDKLAYGVRVPFTSTYLYKFDAPQTGDIVIFKNPEGDFYPYIKRVIADSGDVISVSDKSVVVSGYSLPCAQTGSNKAFYECDELVLGGGNHPTRWSHSDSLSLAEIHNYEVPEGALFLMGDNRDNSMDSRYYGAFRVDDIYGKHIYTIPDSGDMVRSIFYILVAFFVLDFIRPWFRRKNK